MTGCSALCSYGSDGNKMGADKTVAEFIETPKSCHKLECEVTGDSSALQSALITLGRRHTLRVRIRKAAPPVLRVTASLRSEPAAARCVPAPVRAPTHGCLHWS